MAVERALCLNCGRSIRILRRKLVDHHAVPVPGMTSTTKFCPGSGRIWVRVT